MSEERISKKDFGLVSDATSVLLEDLANKQIKPQHILLVCLSVVLGQALKFSQNKFDLFHLMTASMVFAETSNQGIKQDGCIQSRSNENEESDEDEEISKTLH